MMPTYSWRCAKCDEVVDMFLSLSEYINHPPAFFHCAEQMVRYFPPTGRGIDPVGDRLYEGLRASDGTDISTRTKHREYMRRHGLTTMDDFRDTWDRAEKEREAYRTTGKGGAVSSNDIAREWDRHADRSDR
jgi:hypothetical protein